MFLASFLPEYNNLPKVIWNKESFSLCAEGEFWYLISMLMCPSLGWWCDLLSYSTLNLNEARSEQPLSITAEEKVTYEPATPTQAWVRNPIGCHHNYGATIPDIICDILMHLFNWVSHFTRVSFSSVYMALGHFKMKPGAYFLHKVYSIAATAKARFCNKFSFLHFKTIVRLQSPAVNIFPVIIQSSPFISKDYESLCK